MATALPRRAILFLLAAGLGCSSSELLLPEPPAIENVALSKIDGDGQEGTVGEQLQKPLVVQVLTVNRENPAAGMTVEFVTTRGTEEVARTSAVTNSEGTASIQYVLGTAPGDYVIQARLADAGEEAEGEQFLAHARPGPPDSLSAKPPTSRPGRRGEEFHPVIQVLDRFGNPVPQASVAWSVKSGEGVVSETISLTDPSGTATVKWTLGGRPGVQRISAAVGPEPVKGSPASFTATVLF